MALPISLTSYMRLSLLLLRLRQPQSLCTYHQCLLVRTAVFTEVRTRGSASLVDAALYGRDTGLRSLGSDD